MTVGNCVYELVKILNTPSARLDVELLIGKILKCSREKLYTMWDKALNFREIQQVKNLFKQRRKGWPVAYLIGEKEFYGQVFKIKSPVFIPRPDTECLVSSVLSQNEKDDEITIVDLGSGSGCVGLSLLKHMHNSHLVAVDKDSTAIQLSRLNADQLGLANRSFFLEKDVSHLQRQDLNQTGFEFSELRASLSLVNKLQTPELSKMLIVANPPYIALDDPQVQTEVINFESSLALFSGNKGFGHIYSWLTVAQNLLHSGEHYFFEIGAEQSHQFYIGQKVNNMYCINKFKDLSGKIRVIQFERI